MSHADPGENPNDTRGTEMRADPGVYFVIRL
jgi:hypothetical protein